MSMLSIFAMPFKYSCCIEDKVAYVGMIIIRRARQETKAESDMASREVGSDTLVRAELSIPKQIRKIKIFPLTHTDMRTYIQLCKIQSIQSNQK